VTVLNSSTLVTLTPDFTRQRNRFRASKSRPVCFQVSTGISLPDKGCAGPIAVGKMKNKLSIIFSLSLAALLAPAVQTEYLEPMNATTRATDAYGCYKSGLSWADLGTTQEIYTAYNEQWCQYHLGWWAVGATVNKSGQASYT
jgi:hypothetical protein